MKPPVNFDSIPLDGLLSDWVSVLRGYSVEAVVILGPDPFGGVEDREVVAVHPPIVADAAKALAQSRDFGATWRETDGPMVAWQHIAKADILGTVRWRLLALARGFQTVVRIEFSLPAGRAFECFMFSPRQLHDRAVAEALAWSALNIWPQVRRAIATSRSLLSPRESESLRLTFEGLTARQAGQPYEYVIPRATILIENPVAVVDRYAEKHGTRELAAGFVAFLGSPEAQRAFAEYGYRPVDAGVAQEVAGRFPAVTDLFTVRDLGGWPEVQKTLFAPGALYDRVARATGARR